MVAALESFGRFAAFAAAAFFALPSALIHPRETLRQFYALLLGALPLAAVAGLAIGVVLWMHTRSALLRNGGTESLQLLPTVLAIAIIYEFAPIGAGLIVAGRTGASLGAEIGSMRLTEQVDALEILGVSPMRSLVAPRVLACTLALPLLTILMDYLALAGSFAAESSAGGATWIQYQAASLRGLRMPEVVLGTLKTLAFGYLIGVSGCYFGMTATGGTEGVGRAATGGVVAATLGVVLSNVVLVRLIQLVV